MKRALWPVLSILLSCTLMLSSCKKEDDSSAELPDPDPTIDFIGDVGYVSTDMEMGINAEFKVGISATNSGGEKNLVSFVVVRTYLSISDTVLKHSFSSPEFSWESTYNALQYTGKEEWSFTIRDENGKKASLSFEITTFDDTPILSFNQNAGFVYEDSELIVGSEFNVGITASSPVAGRNLDNLIVVRSYMNVPDTVLNLSISSPQYSWDSVFNAHANTGAEVWTFYITDEEDVPADLSFVISTIIEEDEVLSFLNIDLGSYNSTVYGPFFSTSTGDVYFRNEASLQQELIDFAFYLGATNKSTLGAPSNVDVITVYDLHSLGWTIFNTTLFREAGITGAEFDDIGTNYSFPPFSGGEDDINHLEYDDVVFFKTQNEKRGYVKINFINRKGDGINIDVKVEQ